MPHPERGFTQGLIVSDGTVWESAGGYGSSALRRYSLGATEVAASAALPPELWAEGICRVGTSVWQLTWKERVALRWDATTLEPVEKIPFNREGWGICAVPQDQNREGEVVTSDGTSELVRRDPVTLEARAVVQVRCRGYRVRWLNDLAWAGGLVWANVLGTTFIAGIDLASGEVTDVVDARAARERYGDPELVMNGIAPMGHPGEFLLTGKGWRSIRRVRLVAARERRQVDRMLAGPSASYGR
jgi:glutaminyl-peptide cyclotransferase